MRVAIQGTYGSFSEAAARRRWPDLVTVPCREAKDVVAAVRAGEAEAGCLPIENSLIGSVTTTYDLLEEAFGDGVLRLTHEILYPVHHTLMAMPGAQHRGDPARALAPRGARPVPDLARSQSAAGGAGQRLGHGRQRGAGGAGGQTGPGGDRGAARGRRPRAGPAGRADRGRSHQPDPVPHVHPERRRGAARRRHRHAAATRRRSSC